MTTDNPTSVLTFVTYRCDDGVAHITLNRPERLNAISPALASDLLVALDRAVTDDARVILLDGAGRAFCAGHDLKEEDPEPGSPESETHLATLQAITDRLVSPSLASIALIHGYVLGAGAEVALACDIIIAADSAHIAFPEVSVGLSVTGGGSYLLPLSVGLHRAKQLMMLGESLGADQAQEWGMVSQVVPGDTLAQTGEEIAARLLALPRESLSMAKKALQVSGLLGLSGTMELEVDHARQTLNSEELRTTRDAYWDGRD
jgi:enoyl-CoA hydratase/carnithine racemase